MTQWYNTFTCHDRRAIAGQSYRLWVKAQKEGLLKGSPNLVSCFVFGGRLFVAISIFRNTESALRRGFP